MERRIDQDFRGLLMQGARDAIVYGLGWLHLYYDQAGALRCGRTRGAWRDWMGRRMRPIFGSGGTAF